MQWFSCRFDKIRETLEKIVLSRQPLRCHLILFFILNFQEMNLFSYSYENRILIEQNEWATELQIGQGT